MFLFPDVINYESLFKGRYNVSIPNENLGDEVIRILNVPYCINLMAGGNYSKGRLMSYTSISGNEHHHLEKTAEESSPLAERIKPHHHDYFELMYVLDGMVEQYIENGCFLYEKGHACLMNRNTRHYEVFGDNYFVLYLCLSHDYVRKNIIGTQVINESESPISAFFVKNLEEQALYQRDYIECTPLDNSRLEELTSLLETLAQELILKQPGFTGMAQGLITRFFSFLQDEEKYSINHNKLDSSAEAYLFDKITQMMEQQSERMTRSRLAEELSYSGDYINRVVKKHSGMSISAYNTLISLHKAEHMLAATNDNITSIISKLGFENKTRFYKLFQKKHGITPMEYRATHKDI